MVQESSVIGKKTIDSFARQNPLDNTQEGLGELMKLQMGVGRWAPYLGCYL